MVLLNTLPVTTSTNLYDLTIIIVIHITRQVALAAGYTLYVCHPYPLDIHFCKLMLGNTSEIHDL